MAGVTDALTVRVMRPADIAGGDRLRSLANWNQTPEDWARVLSWEPRGCFVAEQNGRLVGTVTTTTFGTDLAWIGMMLVDPEIRRQGVGRQVLSQAIDWLERVRGLRCIGLDATPIGKVLYDTMGFADAYTLQRWEGAAPHVGRPQGARQLADGDLGRLAELDCNACGVDRMRVIRDVVAAHPAGCFVLEDGGELKGYACSRPGARRWYIGPVVAADPDVAGALLRAVLAPLTEQPVVIDIIDSNEPAKRFARDAGFEVVRPFTRMVRGDPLALADTRGVYAIVGPEVG